MLSVRVYESLANGQCPVTLGGDHSIAIGSILGVARYCQERQLPLTILWLDAHADFNTPATSPSGNLHGMPVALLTDPNSEMLRRMGTDYRHVAVENFQLIGIRSVDRVEKQSVVAAGLEVHDMREIDELGIRTVMGEVLDKAKVRGGHLHVSFDIDFLDPMIAPGTGTRVKGGPTYREAQLCMEMIYDSGLFGSLDLVEINPALDIRNQTAEIAVEMIASLFGEQIMARSLGSKR
jgi:arginase